MYLPEPGNLIFIGFKGSGNQGFYKQKKFLLHFIKTRYTEIIIITFLLSVISIGTFTSATSLSMLSKQFGITSDSPPA
ncbi:hypothetical protein HanIR_Chr12g0566381 [Helianthus annuus]|nr:hypothetical protein HanIR_Chr12g0566381 [Helianthus annuus]